MKPVAILSSNLERTIEWAVNILGVNRIDISNRRLVRVNDKHEHESTYIIVQEHEHEKVLSWEFSNVIKAPDYYTLEDITRQRVR